MPHELRCFFRLAGVLIQSAAAGLPGGYAHAVADAIQDKNRGVECFSIGDARDTTEKQANRAFFLACGRIKCLPGRREKAFFVCFHAGKYDRRQLPQDFVDQIPVPEIDFSEQMDCAAFLEQIQPTA